MNKNLVIEANERINDADDALLSMPPELAVQIIRECVRRQSSWQSVCACEIAREVFELRGIDDTGLIKFAELLHKHANHLIDDGPMDWKVVESGLPQLDRAVEVLRSRGVDASIGQSFPDPETPTEVAYRLSQDASEAIGRGDLKGARDLLQKACEFKDHDVL